MVHGIGRGSHRTARSGVVRCVFTQGDRIVGCRIVYVIFHIVVIA